MAITASRPAKSLEIRVLYCKDLRTFNFFKKIYVYAAVSIHSQDPSIELPPQDRRRTPTDRDGDGNPEWNHTLSLDITRIISGLHREDYDRVFVRFDLFHEGGMFGDKRIGEVHVPLSEVIEEEGRGSTRFVSYQVKNPEGKPNGVLTFAYKLEGEIEGGPTGKGFGAVEETRGSSGPASSLVGGTSYYQPPMGYPISPPKGYPIQMAAGVGCYYPAAQPMLAFGPWKQGHHHGYIHHCSARGGGGWWRR